MIKYPAFVTAQCKWCGAKFQFFATSWRWRHNHQYCSEEHHSFCRRAWKRGGSKIDGPLIGKIDVTAKKKSNYDYCIVEPEDFKQYKEGKKNARQGLSANDQEYWDALRRHKGIEVRGAGYQDSE